MNTLFEEYLKGISWEKEPLNLYRPVAYALESGGKRLRSSLLLMASDVFGGMPKTCLDAATAIELFHNFTLLHDDILDDSPTRRGKPSVKAKWNAGTALLSGDAMLIKAYQYLHKVPEEKLSDILGIFSKTALEVCEGQQYDLDFEDRSVVTLEEYYTMIRLKTAVLIACSLKIGACLGNAHVSDANMLYDYGIALGMAFQLQDDYLDLYGDFETFGKPIGMDILSRKKSFLNLRAYEMASPEVKQQLDDLFANKALAPDEKINQARTIYSALHMEEVCQNEIQRFMDQALKCLSQIHENAKSLQPFKDLVVSMNHRQK